MRWILVTISGLVPLIGIADGNLASKVIRLQLSQDQPTEIKLGTQGITTIEFPEKIEALDGFGFSANPLPNGPDLFQISFNKGTNFLSLKAIRPGVEGNLTVVIGGKVYAIFCKEAPDASFVVIFHENETKNSAVASGEQRPPPMKPASAARLLGFLDKVKGFPTLKVSAPEVYQNLDVAEPNSQSVINGIEVNLKRVIRDDALDSLSFEIQLRNKTDKDFFYDPESLGVRTGNEVYQQSVSDAGGMVPAGKMQTAFFIITGGANGDRNDLAVTNKFDVVLRQIQGELDQKSSAEWQEPPGTLPTRLDRGDGTNGTKSNLHEKNNRRARKQDKNGNPSPSPTGKQVAQHAQ
jgi:hypothetical protein